MVRKQIIKDMGLLRGFADMGKVAEMKAAAIKLGYKAQLKIPTAATDIGPQLAVCTAGSKVGQVLLNLDPDRAKLLTLACQECGVYDFTVAERWCSFKEWSAKDEFSQVEKHLREAGWTTFFADLPSDGTKTTPIKGGRLVLSLIHI